MRVPVLDGPKVASRPIGTPYSNTDNSTGLEDVAKGLGQLGSSVVNQGLGVVGAGDRAYAEAKQRAAAAKERADAIAANDALSALTHHSNTLSYGDVRQKASDAKYGADIDQQFQTELFGDEASPAGFMNLRGKEAVGGSAAALDALDKARADIASKLANDEQRKLFMTHSASIVEGTRVRAEEHANAQVKVAEEASLEGRKATTLNAIANDYANDALVADQSKAVEGTLRAFAVSPEDADAKVAAWKTSVASARLNMFLANKDWKGAESLYATSKSDLGIHAPQYEQQISTLKKDAEGETLAAKLVDASTNPRNGRVDPEKAVAALDQVPEGPLRDEARQRLEHRVAVATHQWDQKIDGTFNRALSGYLQGGMGAVDPRDKAWLLDKENGAADKWRQLQMIARADAEHARALHGAGQPKTPDQISAYNAFLVDVADNPEKYATMPIEQFNSRVLPGLARSDWDNAGQVLAGTHKTAGKGDQALAPVENKVLLEMGRDAGVFPSKESDPAKWDLEQMKIYTRATGELTERMKQYHRATGKEAPLEQVQQWASDLFLKGKDPGKGFLGFGGNTTLIESSMKGTGFEPKFSSEDKDAAEAALKKAGARTDEAAVEAYLRRKHKLPALPAAAAPVETTPEIPTQTTPAANGAPAESALSGSKF